MPLDSDVALLGTGVAPLVAANYLLAQGKTVLLLNPDWDFFLEDSELPLDPLFQSPSPIQRLKNSSPDHVLEVLRPDFPGSIEFWSSSQGGNLGYSDSSGFHDHTAPHVRQRARLWISSQDQTPNQQWNWENLEDLYVEASDQGLNPQILEGLSAAKRFPGFSAHHGNFRGLYIPKSYDVDVNRYRNGLLEFVRERLGPERVISAATQIETIPEGIRFHSKNTSQTARLKDGLLVFWTPRLTPWVIHQSKKAEVTPRLPSGVRLWEQWCLNSREPADPSTIGMLGDMAVWANFEGSNQVTSLLTVLRAGPKVSLEGLHLPQGGLSWASSESLGALSRLCNGFLKWDRFSIRSMKARAIFEWSQTEPWTLCKSSPTVQIIPACDGPLMNVVSVARASCEPILF